ncbi:MAG: PD40 domain-containing protein [Deltaproteobacteria bacterium]|nr:PD40 domain-containing protein [Deltaproteobacteria bacterium]
MGHNVFISYSHKDNVIADTVVASLERNGVRCWYAPRDINPSDDWGDAISKAIEKSEIFLIIFSGSSNQSRHVLDELILAIDEEVPVFPFRVENLEPKGAMRLHLSSRHWLDAYDPSWEEHIEKLVQTICANLDISFEKKEPELAAKVRQTPKSIEKKKFKKIIYAAGIGAVLIFLGWILWSNFLRDNVQVQDVISSAFGLSLETPSETPAETPVKTPTQTEQDVQKTLGEWNNECRIAYSFLSTNTFSIWLMQPDGSNKTLVSSDEYDDFYPKWSWTGEMIAFISNPLDMQSQISLIHLDWSDPLPFSVGRVSNIENNYQFEWSPVGDPVIAYVSEENGNADIIVTQFGNSDNKIVIDQANDTNPTWSPDGEKIAFVSDREGNMDLFVVDVRGGDLNVLTKNSADDVEPSWSPDGEKIAFASDRDGPFHIYTMHADGSNLVRITETGDNRHPTWSNDGSMIAFYSERNEDSGFYVSSEDGSEIRMPIEIEPDCSESSELNERIFVSFSPDDTEIVLSMCGVVYRMDSGGKKVDRMGTGFHPVWSPLCRR